MSRSMGGMGVAVWVFYLRTHIFTNSEVQRFSLVGGTFRLKCSFGNIKSFLAYSSISHLAHVHLGVKAHPPPSTVPFPTPITCPAVCPFGTATLFFFLLAPVPPRLIPLPRFASALPTFRPCSLAFGPFPLFFLVFDWL